MSTKPRVQVVAVSVFGSCFQEHWHDTETPPSGYSAVAVVKVDGSEHRLDYDLSYEPDYVVCSPDRSAIQRLALSAEEAGGLQAEVEKLVDLAFESGTVGDGFDGTDFPVSGPITFTMPSFLANRR